MPSGTNTIVLDKDEVRFREARALGKTLALRHELEASPATRAASGAQQHFFGSTFARVQKEAKTIYPQKGIFSGTDTERIPRTGSTATRATCRAESAYGSTFGRTCGDCLDEFQRPYQRRRRRAIGSSPSPISVASPIKRSDALVRFVWVSSAFGPGQDPPAGSDPRAEPEPALWLHFQIRWHLAAF